MLAIRPHTKSGFLDEQQRPGLQPPDQEAPEQHRRGGEPGTPSVIIGRSAAVPAACAAVSGATTPSTLPLPKILAVLGEAPRQAVAHERRRRRPARHDPHEAPYRGAAQEVAQ